jgi:putative transcriptional regulator
MGERKLHQSDVARGAMLSKGVVFDLYHERTRRIDYETLEKLCRFFGCQPGDLLVYVPEGSGTGQAPEPEAGGRKRKAKA